MRKEDLKIGLAVSFHKLKNGRCIGLESEVYIIDDIDFKNWGVCNCLLRSGEATVYTNHEGIEPAIEPVIKQFSIFDYI